MGQELEPPAEPLRVVFFTASYFVLDGVTLTIRKILAALKEIGAETLVITAAPTQDTMGEIGALEGENLVLVPGMPVPLDSEHYGYALGLGLSREARKRLEEFRPHVAHFTVCDLLGMDGVKWAEANNVAMVGTWHSNYCDYIKFYSAAWWLTPVLRRYIQQFYGAIPTTFVPTDFMRLKLTKEGYDQFTDMQIWGRGVDLERFSPARRSTAFRRRIGAKDSDIVLIWVGRLVPEKRPDVWRDVLKKLHDEGHAIRGAVVGVGPCQTYFDGIPYIQTLGWMSGVELAEAYASADILLFPSDVETFGNVTLEALGCGIPAVVEENCSRHLVSDGVEGFAVHQGIDDPNDRSQYEACLNRYFTKVRQLVVDPDLRAKCARNARVKADTYSNSMVQQRMIDNYHHALNTQVRNRAPPREGARFQEVRTNVLHWFFAYAARVVIFVLWLLLGLPQVTETNLAETNIRTAVVEGEQLV
eukprot:CAMPEP_0118977154 /NCGR_PEP_ID=MMETSP1173-20130426/20636_1 /TAXON_ID=1034831 /ORGANISM="Rhizochromulina marina cf, Strain CCMP1243" /LENGTH=472 /DNA_ID=CAMNT_0006927231 /DNA_START=158 /DNA_END=1576 /DNA_ORIENTATION=+